MSWRQRTFVSSSTGSSADRRRVAAVIVAGGSGRRFGAEVPKQYVELAGVPVLARAVRAFRAHPRVNTIVVVLPAPDAERPPEWLAGPAIEVVAGGEERGDSVWNGLSRTPADAEVVLIHDGARPLVDADVIDRVIDAVGPDEGAIAALPVADTLKRVDGDGRIVGTQDRAGLWQAQTPQGFPREAILDVYRHAREAGVRGTDDASLCERFGLAVRTVLGSPYTFKVTHPADLQMAEALLVARGDRA